MRKSIFFLFFLCFSFYSINATINNEDDTLSQKRILKTKKFLIYDGMRYAGKPLNLSAQSLQPFMLIPEWALTKKDDKDPGKVVIDTSKVNTWIDKAIKSNQKIICTDIESWYKEKGITSEELTKRFGMLYGMFRKRIDNVEIGNYGLPVSALCVDRANAQGKYQENILIGKWLQTSQRRMVDPEIIDFFSPSLYIVTPDVGQWIKDLETSVSIMRKIDPNKKIIPFIWPSYYTLKGGSPYSGKYIESEVWAKMLNALSKYCDGVIIWGPSTDKWQDANLQKVIKTTNTFIKQQTK